MANQGFALPVIGGLLCLSSEGAKPATHCEEVSKYLLTYCRTGSSLYIYRVYLLTVRREAPRCERRGGGGFSHLLTSFCATSCSPQQ